MTQRTAFTLPAKYCMDPLARSILRRHRDRMLLGILVFVLAVIIDQLQGCR